MGTLQGKPSQQATKSIRKNKTTQWPVVFRRDVAMCRAAGCARLLAAAAQRNSRTATALAVSAGDGPPRVPMQTIGPPLTDGHRMMRKGGPTVRDSIVRARPPRLRTIARTPLVSVTVRSGEWTITAQTPEEQTLCIARGGPMRGYRTRLLGPPTHVVPRTDTTIGAVSPGATGTTLHVRKAVCTRAATSLKATGGRIKMLHRPVHVAGLGAMIAHRWGRITVADPLQCR